MLNGLVYAAHCKVFSKRSLTVCCVSVCVEREGMGVVCALMFVRFDQGRLGQNRLKYVELNQAFRGEV